MKLLYLFISLTLTQSLEEESFNAILIDYDSMYSNECTTTTTSSTSTTSSAPLPSVSPTPSPVEGWEKYEKEYGEKYENKYENKYEGSGNPGSVSGNRIGGDDSNSENKQNSVFCKCLAEEKKQGKGYAASQNSFSKCIDKADGNDAKHWERVAEKYGKKFGVKGHFGKLPQITTTANPEGVATVADEDDEALFVNVSSNDESDGTAAVFVTLIGSSVLLFICAWFIKKSFKKFWVSKDYDSINNGKFNVVENDKRNVVNYQGSKNRFAGWNQYSSV